MNHNDFAGFFSADAIQAAIRQANASNQDGSGGNDDDADSGENESDDGT
eukprot:CAMPEP_0172472702 /NCGR_PEP_ID=MMETSP1065-20121228/68478_1 /TAXON_ID=265537 /ORGANISM="Amphiprora paludosa, Strain CCMP125" /LENGTH=48 /DNA_ID= /DNA_START= /DNA_END= /DNA_ORIENTATION=